MDDPRAVRLREGDGGVEQRAADLVGGEGPFGVEDLPEVPSAEVLHAQVRAPLLGAHVVDAHHVLPFDLRGGARFLDEALDGAGARRGLRME